VTGETKLPVDDLAVN